MNVLTNARIVLPDAVVLGSLVLRDELIEKIDEGSSSLCKAIDCSGDFIIPGVVDMHTDNLERQLQPRNSARWPSRSAMVAHDAQCAAAGVTTMLDALCVGNLGLIDRGPTRPIATGWPTWTRLPRPDF